MRILLLGNAAAPFSSESYYYKTLTEMGHHVICLQENRATKEQILANDVDMFFWIHTHGKDWVVQGMDEVLAEFRMRGIPSFGYHLDLYMGIQRWRQYQRDTYFTVDHFFTVDLLMANWLNENTNCKGHFLPAGCYKGESFIGTPNQEKYPHEVIFTGSKGYHPEYPYRSQLIDWLHSKYGDRFGHYGGGGMPTIRGPELNNLYASTKIVIGDTLCKGFNYPYYLSDRTFEVPARGGFMIFPYIKGLENHFDLEKEMVTFQYNNWDQLERLVNYYLEHDDEREAIRLAGHERAKCDHTYTNRMETILETIAKHKQL